MNQNQIAENKLFNEVFETLLKGFPDLDLLDCTTDSEVTVVVQAVTKSYLLQKYQKLQYIFSNLTCTKSIKLQTSVEITLKSHVQINSNTLVDQNLLLITIRWNKENLVDTQVFFSDIPVILLLIVATLDSIDPIYIEK